MTPLCIKQLITTEQQSSDVCQKLQTGAFVFEDECKQMQPGSHWPRKRKASLLWNRAGHYIFALCFLLSSSFFLFPPRLISAVADWMFAILAHMMWP